MAQQGEIRGDNGFLEMTNAPSGVGAPSTQPSAAMESDMDVSSGLPHHGEIKGSVASASSSDSESICRGRRMYIALATTFVILLMVILPLTITDNQRSNNRSSEPEALRNTKFFDVVDYLATSGVSEAIALATNSTPQYKAAQWIAEQDGANMPVPLRANSSLLDRVLQAGHFSRQATPISRRQDTLTAVPTKEERESKAYHYKYIVRYVLALDFFALGSPTLWTSTSKFLSPRDVCSWKGPVPIGANYQIVGVFCKDDQGDPTELLLGQAAAKSQLPTENGLLQSLLRFDVQSSLITGTIPTDLCRLKRLQGFLLSQNALTGTLPPCLGKLTDLRLLYTSKNLMTGPLPATLGNLTNLERLVIEDNEFSGDPTPIWSKLRNLQLLFADHNNFSGTLPRDFLLNHHNMSDLDISNNKFTTSGNSFPTHFFAMRGLANLDLSNNPLNATIQSDLILPGTDGSGKLRRNRVLQFLSLHSTLMKGVLPRVDGLLALQYLDLSSNGFEGTMHTEYAQLPGLKSLFLSNNDGLSGGTIPTDFAKLTQLQDLSLRSTNLTGSIPSFLGAMKSLSLLDLGQNVFNETIPKELGTLTNLKYLLLNGNRLTGNIDALLPLINLSVLLVDGNHLKFSYNCNARPIPLLLYADCRIVSKEAASSVEVKCFNCCQCCYSLDTGCSQPLLAHIDASQASSFSRTSYDFGSRVQTFTGNNHSRV
jgi:Leucine-rich repeat (LRR) protein